MVAIAQTFSAKASTNGAAKVQAQPALSLRRFGQARLSANLSTGMHKLAPTFVSSRNVGRCDQNEVNMLLARQIITECARQSPIISFRIYLISITRPVRDGDVTNLISYRLQVYRCDGGCWQEWLCR